MINLHWYKLIFACNVAVIHCLPLTHHTFWTAESSTYGNVWSCPDLLSINVLSGWSITAAAERSLLFPHGKLPEIPILICKRQQGWILIQSCWSGESEQREVVASIMSKSWSRAGVKNDQARHQLSATESPITGWEAPLSFINFSPAWKGQAPAHPSLLIWMLSLLSCTEDPGLWKRHRCLSISMLQVFVWSWTLSLIVNSSRCTYLTFIWWNMHVSGALDPYPHTHLSHGEEAVLSTIRTTPLNYISQYNCSLQTLRLTSNIQTVQKCINKLICFQFDCGKMNITLLVIEANTGQNKIKHCRLIPASTSLTHSAPNRTQVE